MSEEKPLTHDAWQTHWRNGRFVRWVHEGEGRIDTDSDGNAVAHLYYFGTARGDNGHTVLMPKGMSPSRPTQPIENTKTHDAWQSHWSNGKFVEWVKQGRGWLDMDGEGGAIAHVYFFGTARGDSGHTILMPKAMTPPSPQSEPKRPPKSSSTEETEEEI